MYLYLVRHGEAKPKEQDPERPLTERGSETVRRVAALMGGMRLSVGGIHHSTKLRARQTAEILAAGSGAVVPVTQVPNLEPQADVDELAESLSAATTDLMLVGHLPHLDRLASRLVSGDAGVKSSRSPSAGCSACTGDRRARVGRVDRPGRLAGCSIRVRFPEPRQTCWP